MKKLICLALALFASAAIANDQLVRGPSLQVKERLQAIELINVTAEKQRAADAEPLDEALLAILDEAESLEIDES